ncbi:hypothetical protein DV738_g1523, partial [Chaetothyriales sp. CBS 135597]
MARGRSGNARSGDDKSALEFELEHGIPQHDDPFIQKYMSGRQALIEQEKKQRHDHVFKQTMTPLAKQAAKIMEAVRRKELQSVWTSDFEQSLADKNGGNLYPGMMFTLARDRMETTELWKMIERMPKGALLHAHLDAMVDIDWLIDQILNEPGLCLQTLEPLSDETARESALIYIRYYPDSVLSKLTGKNSSSSSKNNSIWTRHYDPNTPISLREAQRTFPEHDRTFKKWLASRCTITSEESLAHHHGPDAIWRKFQSCFLTINQMLFYEPIFRRALRRMLEQLVADGITYIDFRAAFRFQWRATGQTEPCKDDTDNHDGTSADCFFKTFGEIISEFQKQDDEAQSQQHKFHSARMIWTNIRADDTRTQARHMQRCIHMKQKYPHLVSGFDFVGQEDRGRTLADLTPLVFWFRKQCATAGVEIPFFFHAGECLGDGDATDNNLFDAILLGTRRLGHAYSLARHPLLTDMVRDKRILVESCPISNEVLRLASSIRAHSLPALLARGVPCSLNNDDPAILGHGRNGLTHDFAQAYMAWDNLGLEGLAVMAENSLRWAAVVDQNPGDWAKAISEGYMGKTVKAKLLRQWRSEFEKWFAQ